MIDKERVPEINSNNASQQELNAAQERLLHSPKHDKFLAEIWYGDTCKPNELMSNLTKSTEDLGIQSEIQALKQDEASSVRYGEGNLVQKDTVKLSRKLPSKATSQCVMQGETQVDYRRTIQTKNRTVTQASRQTKRRAVQQADYPLENIFVIGINEQSKGRNTKHSKQQCTARNKCILSGATLNLTAEYSDTPMLNIGEFHKPNDQTVLAADSSSLVSSPSSVYISHTSHTFHDSCRENSLCMEQTLGASAALPNVESKKTGSVKVRKRRTESRSGLSISTDKVAVNTKSQVTKSQDGVTQAGVDTENTSATTKVMQSMQQVNAIVQPKRRGRSPKNRQLANVEGEQKSDSKREQQSKHTAHTAHTAGDAAKETCKLNVDRPRDIDLQSLSFSLSMTPHINLIGASATAQTFFNTAAKTDLSVACNREQVVHQEGYQVETSVKTPKDVPALSSRTMSYEYSETVDSSILEGVSNTSPHDLLVALGLASSTTSNLSTLATADRSHNAFDTSHNASNPLSKVSNTSTHVSNTSTQAYNTSSNSSVGVTFSTNTLATTSNLLYKSTISLPADFSITPPVKVYSITERAIKSETKVEPEIVADKEVKESDKIRKDLCESGKKSAEQSTPISLGESSAISSWSSQERGRLSRDLEPFAYRIADALEAENAAHTTKGKHQDKDSLLKMDELFDIRKMQITGLTTGQLLQLWSKVDNSGFPVNLPQRIIVRNYFKLFNMSDLQNCEIEYCFDPESEWYKNLSNQASRYRSAVMSKNTKAKHTTNVESVNLEYDDNEDAIKPDDDF